MSRGKESDKGGFVPAIHTPVLTLFHPASYILYTINERNRGTHDLARSVERWIHTRFLSTFELCPL